MATDIRTVNAGREPSFGTLIQDIGASLDRMLRAELRLAMAEVRGDVGGLGAAATRLWIGAIVATLAATFLLLGAVAGLMQVLPAWAAALAVGGATGVVALILLARARGQMSQVLATMRTDAPETKS